MLYLLDAYAISDAVAENKPLVGRLAVVAPHGRVVTCVIARGEVLFGSERIPPGKRRDDLRRKVDVVLGPMDCEPVPDAAADHYARTKLARQQAGRPMDENDLWIAATALALGAVLVTRDTDFLNVPGLSVEDWTKP